jgi:predicted dehydrogenase
MPELSHVKSVAMAGCGNVADILDEDRRKRHFYSHTTAISRLDQLNITACCDIDPARMERFADKWGINGRYTDYQKMVDEEKIDILVIATPTMTHYDYVLTALTKEIKVIFCEKPFTYTLKEGETLVKKAAEAGKLIFVNYMRRWDSFYTECKNLLEGGRIGRVETIVAYVDTALYMNSIHMLDMVLYLAGDVLSCTGFLDTVSEPRVVHGREDRGGIALFHHKNGIISFVKATGETQRNHFFELDIQGTKGRLRILDDDIRYELYEFKESPQHAEMEELHLVHTEYNRDKQERVVDAYRDILDCLNTGKEPAFSGKDALKPLELIEMIYKSDSQGHAPITGREQT